MALSSGTNRHAVTHGGNSFYLKNYRRCPPSASRHAWSPRYHFVVGLSPSIAALRPAGFCEDFQHSEVKPLLAGYGADLACEIDQGSELWSLRSTRECSARGFSAGAARALSSGRATGLDKRPPIDDMSQPGSGPIPPGRRSPGGRRRWGRIWKGGNVTWRTGQVFHCAVAASDRALLRNLNRPLDRLLLAVSRCAVFIPITIIAHRARWRSQFGSRASSESFVRIWNRRPLNRCG